MANHKSALKRAKQNEIKRLRNRSVKTRIKSVTKQLRADIEAQETEKINPGLIQTQSIIAKAAKKGVIHKKNAARKISRLSKSANNATA